MNDHAWWNTKWICLCGELNFYYRMGFEELIQNQLLTRYSTFVRIQERIKWQLISYL
jgi:hypothetical protein